MSGPLARVLAQVLVAGFGVVTRAFVQAYQQAAANPNAAKNAAKNAQKAVRNRMEIEEALKIMNFEQTPKSIDHVLQRYDKYFNANDPKNGGSYYLQSKFFRAKEAIEEELVKDTKKSEVKE